MGDLRHELTPKKREEFLSGLARGSTVSGAARSIAISRQHLYAVRDRDEAFRAAWEEAIEEGTDVLEDEAFRRAVHGTDKPVFYRGDECGTVREYSDTLAIFLLKGRRREKFGDKQDVKLGGSLTLEQLVLASLPPEAG